MTLTLLIAVAASLCWGASDFAAGVKTRRLSVWSVLAVGQTVGLVVSVIVAVAIPHRFPTTVALLGAVGAGLGGVGGLACFYRALASGTMSVVAPIAATGVMVPVVVGVLGGDRLTAIQVAGMAAAIGGVVLASRQPEGGEDGHRARHRRSVALALVAAVGFGSYFIGAHLGVRGGIGWQLVFSHAAIVVALGGVALVARDSVGGLPALVEVPSLVAIGLVDIAATTLYAVASNRGLLSIVAVAGSLYPVATVLLARVVLRERLVAAQGVGVTLALAGVAMLAA